MHHHATTHNDTQELTRLRRIFLLILHLASLFGHCGWPRQTSVFRFTPSVTLRKENRHGRIECEECRFLSGLRHPNVVQFMGVHYGRDGWGRHQFHHGVHAHGLGILHKDIPCRFPASPQVTRDQHPQRCGIPGLTRYLHSLNIVHRDLNTENILLTEALRAMVADLGVAKLFDREPAVTRTTSSLEFMISCHQIL